MHVIHDLAELSPSLGSDAVRVVVSGHSHKPAVREDAGLLFVITSYSIHYTKLYD